MQFVSIHPVSPSLSFTANACSSVAKRWAECCSTRSYMRPALRLSVCSTPAYGNNSFDPGWGGATRLEHIQVRGAKVLFCGIERVYQQGTAQWIYLHPQLQE